MATAGRGGERLLSAFRAANCPGVAAWTGSDLDWVYEIPGAQEFLDRMANLLNADAGSMVLVEDEVGEWERVVEQEGGEILEGDLLREAVKTLETKEAASLTSMTVEELREAVARVNEEVSLASAVLDVSARASADLSASRGAQTVDIGRMTRTAERREMELRARQEHVLAWNGMNNVALKELLETVAQVAGRLQNFGSKSGKREMFLAEFGPMVLESAESEYRRVLKTLSEKQFGRQVPPLEQCPSFDILRERTDEEETHAVKELSRLKQSYSLSERQRVLQLANHAGENAAQMTLQQMAQKWEKGGIPLDENAVRAASAELEKVVGTLQSDIVNMTGETLTDLTDRVAAAEVKKIVASDYHTKVYRQLYDMERLDNFRGFVLDQRSRQCVLESLVHAEKRNLQRLTAMVGEAVKDASVRMRRLDAEGRAMVRLRAMESERKREGIQEDDLVLRTLVAIIAGRDVELSMLTHHEVKSRINGLLDKRSHLREEREQIERELDRHRASLQKDMPRLKKLLGIDSANGESVSLSCPAISTAVSKMQSGVRAFELSLKDTMRAWEKEQKTLKHDPHLATQKRLWVDFVSNPKVLEANVDAMAKKASAAAAQKGF